MPVRIRRQFRVKLRVEETMLHLGDLWEKALADTMKSMRDDAAGFAPRGKTGLLSRSIGYSVKGRGFKAIGWLFTLTRRGDPSPYGYWQEVGSQGRPGRQFLRRARKRNTRKLMRLLRNAA